MEIENCVKQSYLFKQCVINPDFITALTKDNYKLLVEYAIDYTKQSELYDKLMEDNKASEKDRVNVFVTLRRIELILFFAMKHLALVNKYGSWKIEKEVLNKIGRVDMDAVLKTISILDNIRTDLSNAKKEYVGEREDIPIPLYFKPHKLPEGPIDKTILETLWWFYDDIVFFLKFIIHSRKIKRNGETWWVPSSFSFNLYNKDSRDYEVSIQKGDIEENVVLVDTFNSIKSIYNIQEDGDPSYMMLNETQINIQRRINKKIMSRFLYIYLYKIYPDLLRFKITPYTPYFNRIPLTTLYVKYIPEDFDSTESIFHKSDNGFPGCNFEDDKPDILKFYQIYIHNCLAFGASFVLIFMSFIEESGRFAHSVLFIFNNKEKEFEMFDPHGNSEEYIMRVCKKYNSQITRLISSSFREGKTSIPIRRYNLPFQAFQEKEYGGSIADSGTCQTWTTWFAEIRLRYSDKSFEEVAPLLKRHHFDPRVKFSHPGSSNKNLNTMGMYFTNLIRSYTIHIYKNYNGMINTLNTEHELYGINKREQKEYFDCLQKMAPRLPYFSKKETLGYKNITPFIAPQEYSKTNIDLQTHPTGSKVRYIEGTAQERGNRFMADDTVERGSRSRAPGRGDAKSTPRGENAKFAHIPSTSKT